MLGRVVEESTYLTMTKKFFQSKELVPFYNNEVMLIILDDQEVASILVTW